MPKRALLLAPHACSWLTGQPTSSKLSALSELLIIIETGADHLRRHCPEPQSFPRTACTRARKKALSSAAVAKHSRIEQEPRSRTRIALSLGHSPKRVLRLESSIQPMRRTGMSTRTRRARSVNHGEFYRRTTHIWASQDVRPRGRQICMRIALHPMERQC